MKNTLSKLFTAAVAVATCVLVPAQFSYGDATQDSYRKVITSYDYGSATSEYAGEIIYGAEPSANGKSVIALVWTPSMEDSGNHLKEISLVGEPTRELTQPSKCSKSKSESAIGDLRTCPWISDPVVSPNGKLLLYAYEVFEQKLVKKVEALSPEFENTRKISDDFLLLDLTTGESAPLAQKFNSDVQIYNHMVFWKSDSSGFYAPSANAKTLASSRLFFNLKTSKIEIKTSANFYWAMSKNNKYSVVYTYPSFNYKTLKNNPAQVQIKNLKTGKLSLVKGCSAGERFAVLNDGKHIICTQRSGISASQIVIANTSGKSRVLLTADVVYSIGWDDLGEFSISSDEKQVAQFLRWRDTEKKFDYEGMTYAPIKLP